MKNRIKKQKKWSLADKRWKRDFFQMPSDSLYIQISSAKIKNAQIFQVFIFLIIFYFFCLMLECHNDVSDIRTKSYIFCRDSEQCANIQAYVANCSMGDWYIYLYHTNIKYNTSPRPPPYPSNKTYILQCGFISYFNHEFTAEE